MRVAVIDSGVQAAHPHIGAVHGKGLVASLHIVKPGGIEPNAPLASAVIRRAVAAGACGGYFLFRFAGVTGPGQRLLAALINLRTRLGVPYGDQGIFATPGAYERAGGFAREPLFLAGLIILA